MLRLPVIAPAMLVMTVLLMCSCQKEINFSGDDGGTADSIYLTKLIYLDTTQPSGSDTIARHYFDYDGLKRLSGMRIYQSDPTIDTVLYDFRYQGNDSLPYLVVQYNSYRTGLYTATVDSFFFSYNNGFVESDSEIIVNYPGALHNFTEVRKSVSAGSGQAKNYEQYYFFSGNQVTGSTLDSATYLVNRDRANFYSSTLLSGTLPYYQSVQVSYDNKINPLGMIIKIRYNNFDYHGFAGWWVQHNNALQVQYQQASGTGVNNLTYRYRADGYPVSSTYNQTAGSNWYNKALYYYTR